jgi:hypothetical protein
MRTAGLVGLCFVIAIVLLVAAERFLQAYPWSALPAMLIFG